MKHIPNAFTLANLFCGCCALLYTFYWQPEVAALFTLGCFFFDYMDGMAARVLKVISPLGKELDSLADMVSFGVVPGAMMYQLLSGHQAAAVPGADMVQVAALPAFILSVFSGFRLGKFNIDPRQTNYFIGLTTPACTIFVLGLVLTAHYDRFGLAEIISNQWLLYGLIAVLSWLLVCEIPMFAMKLKGLSLSSNALTFSFSALFILLAFLLKELALPVIILCYIVLSIIIKNKILAE